jgi:hypothetical protein
MRYASLNNVNKIFYLSADWKLTRDAVRDIFNREGRVSDVVAQVRSKFDLPSFAKSGIHRAGLFCG